VIFNYVALCNGTENHNKMKAKLHVLFFPLLQRYGNQFNWLSIEAYIAEDHLYAHNLSFRLLANQLDFHVSFSVCLMTGQS
jgi:hypothetical protein